MFNNKLNKYIKIAKLLHPIHPELFDDSGEIIGNTINANIITFKTAKHSYYIKQSLTTDEFFKFKELSNFIEFGKADVHNKIVGIINYLSDIKGSLSVSDLTNINISLAEIAEVTSPDWYRDHKDDVRLACTLFIKREGEGKWNEDLAKQKIADWQTGLIEPKIDDDYMFFFTLYESLKVVFLGNSKNTHLTSYKRMQESQSN